jgi:hypothetical protein
LVAEALEPVAALRAVGRVLRAAGLAANGFVVRLGLAVLAGFGFLGMAFWFNKYAKFDFWISRMPYMACVDNTRGGMAPRDY